MKVHLRWVFLLDAVLVRGASCAASCNFQLRTLLKNYNSLERLLSSLKGAICHLA